MDVSVRRAARALMFLLGVGLAAGGSTAQAATAVAAHEAAWATIVDHDVPLDKRHAALKALEDDAADLGPTDLYVLGSVYHAGHHSGGLVDQPDLTKASLYFGNAATRGSIPAMAKMAELSLARHDYREAMNWAEIYAHYVLAFAPKADTTHGYAAELVKRVSDHYGNNIDDVMRDVDSFVAANDAQIRQGMIDDAMARNAQLHVDHAALAMPGQTLPPLSCVADFLAVIRPDGSVARVMPIDIAPEESTLETMARAMGAAKAPASSGTAPRYALMTAVLDNGRYRSR